MLKTHLRLFKKPWGSAIFFWYIFAPVPPFGILDTSPWEKQVRTSPTCMSCAAPARVRAPLLMVLSSATCHISFACIIITPQFTLSFHIFHSIFHAVTVCHCFTALFVFFFFHPMGCWGMNKLKEHSAKFSRSKGSSTGDGPSWALPLAQSCSASRRLMTALDYFAVL